MPKNALRTINIHEVKTHLSRLVDEGLPFVIAKAGKPKMKVTPLDEPEKAVKSRIGFMKGVFTLPDNFEEIDRELDKEIEKLFNGEEEE